MKQQLLIFIMACLVAMSGFGQDSSSDESPRSLMSSYYQDNFTPFKKGDYYVTLNMSLSSETLQNTEKSFVTVINGNFLEHFTNQQHVTRNVGNFES